jgi:hypothetical protein
MEELGDPAHFLDNAAQEFGGGEGRLGVHIGGGVGDGRARRDGEGADVIVVEIPRVLVVHVPVALVALLTAEIQHSVLTYSRHECMRSGMLTRIRKFVESEGVMGGQNCQGDSWRIMRRMGLIGRRKIYERIEQKHFAEY